MKLTLRVGIQTHLQKSNTIAFNGSDIGPSHHATDV